MNMRHHPSLDLIVTKTEEFSFLYPNPNHGSERNHSPHLLHGWPAETTKPTRQNRAFNATPDKEQLVLQIAIHTEGSQMILRASLAFQTPDGTYQTTFSGEYEGRLRKLNQVFEFGTQHGENEGLDGQSMTSTGKARNQPA